MDFLHASSDFAADNPLLSIAIAGGLGYLAYSFLIDRKPISKDKLKRVRDLTRRVSERRKETSVNSPKARYRGSGSNGSPDSRSSSKSSLKQGRSSSLQELLAGDSAVTLDGIHPEYGFIPTDDSCDDGYSSDCSTGSDVSNASDSSAASELSETSQSSSYRRGFSHTPEFHPSLRETLHLGSSTTMVSPTTHGPAHALAHAVIPSALIADTENSSVLSSSLSHTSTPTSAGDSSFGVIYIDILNGLIPLDLSTFCVVSFGQQVFRTVSTSPTRRPTWEQKCRFIVHKNQLSWPFMFHIYRDRKRGPELVGAISLSAKTLIEKQNTLRTGILTLERPEPKNPEHCYSMVEDFPSTTLEIGSIDDVMIAQASTGALDTIALSFDSVYQPLHTTHCGAHVWADILSMFAITCLDEDRSNVRSSNSNSNSNSTGISGHNDSDHRQVPERVSKHDLSDNQADDDVDVDIVKTVNDGGDSDVEDNVTTPLSPQEERSPVVFPSADDDCNTSVPQTLSDKLVSVSTNATTSPDGSIIYPNEFILLDDLQVIIDSLDYVPSHALEAFNATLATHITVYARRGRAWFSFRKSLPKPTSTSGSSSNTVSGSGSGSGSRFATSGLGNGPEFISDHSVTDGTDASDIELEGESGFDGDEVKPLLSSPTPVPSTSTSSSFPASPLPPSSASIPHVKSTRSGLFGKISQLGSSFGSMTRMIRGTGKSSTKLGTFPLLTHTQTLISSSSSSSGLGQIKVRTKAVKQNSKSDSTTNSSRSDVADTADTTEDDNQATVMKSMPIHVIRSSSKELRRWKVPLFIALVALSDLESHLHTHSRPGNDANITSDSSSASPDNTVAYLSHTATVFRTCPVCLVTLNHLLDPRERHCHVLFCTQSILAAHPTEFATGGFVSPFVAATNWARRLSRRDGTQGSELQSYLASQAEFLLVQNRENGLVFQELVPTALKKSMQLLYQTSITSTLTVSLMNSFSMMERMTHRAGKQMDDPASVSRIPAFIKLHKIDMSQFVGDAEKPGDFGTFNDFFYRKLRPGMRPIAEPDNHDVIVAPADSRFIGFDNVPEATAVWIKGRAFTVESLIGPKLLSLPNINKSEWLDDGCQIMIARLAPQDYHRTHVPMKCIIGPTDDISGGYLSVNPLAVRSSYDVLTTNRRTVTHLVHPDTGLECFYVLVGATLVGSCVITAQEGEVVEKGGEFGYFAFGGSTVVLIFKKNTLKFDEDIERASNRSIETLVKMGQSIATCKKDL